MSRPYGAGSLRALSRRSSSSADESLALDRWLFEVASPNAPASSLNAAASATPSERERLLSLADRQKVLLPVGAALINRFGIEILPQSLRKLFERVVAMRSNHVRMLSEAVEIFDREAVTYAFLRGFGIEAAYPPGYVRQQHDLDPALPDLDSLWVLGTVLLSRGFTVHGLVLRRDEQGRLSGLAVLRRPAPGLDRRAQTTLDFTIGALPLHWNSALPFDTEFWDACRELPGRRPGWVPSHRHAIVLQLAEYLERRRIGARDCLDIAMLLARSTPADRMWCAEVCATYGLGHELGRTARALATMAQGEEGFLLCSEQLMEMSELRSVASAITRYRPFRLAALHDYPLARRHGGHPEAVRAASRSLLRDVAGSVEGRARLRPYVARISLALDSERWMETGSYIAFAPVAGDESAPLSWTRKAGLKFLLTPLGRFLPIPLGAVDAGVLETDARVSKK